MYQNHRLREHNKNGLQPCTKTINQENRKQIDYSDLSAMQLLEQVTFDETKMYATVGVYS